LDSSAPSTRFSVVDSVSSDASLRAAAAAAAARPIDQWEQELRWGMKGR
jgi:hypothetical protein